MACGDFEAGGVPLAISRSGYTGEDGFEISVPADGAEGFAKRLLAEREVAPAGLGARDSLRLEAGLCLYGHDIDETTSPIEAGLAWSIAKRRREQGGFPGAARIQRELKEGPARRRVGIKPEGRAPAREGTVIADAAGAAIGAVTSGGFGATAGGPIAMGYVTAAQAAPGTRVNLMIRGEARPGEIVTLPFVAHRYAKA
jgi:aminomethyltransferase